MEPNRTVDGQAIRYSLNGVSITGVSVEVTGSPCSGKGSDWMYSYGIYIFILMKRTIGRIDCSVSVKVSKYQMPEPVAVALCVARVPLASGRDFGQESDQGGSE